jgi:steroid delta-isomerase-like uncharacterized protein
MNDPRATVEAFIAAFNAGDHDAMLSLLAPDFFDHTPVPGQGKGPEAFVAVKVDGFRTAFEDIDLSKGEMLVDRDRVAYSWSLRARNAGPFAGYPATGRDVHFGGLNLHRVSEGRIVEHWSVYDSLQLLQQLGLFTWGSS